MAQFGAGRALVGVLSRPEAGRTDERRPGVVILNAGLVHRVGPNRVHVALARQFAARGSPALRFDLSGIGDSRAGTGAARSGERRVEETRAAMDWLESESGTGRFFLIGNCSGATVAYLTAHADARVVGVALINPQVPVLMRHFLRTALTHPSTWRRLLSGRARVGNQLGQVLRAAEESTPERTRHDITAGIRALVQRGVELLLTYSEWDPGYDYYRHVLRRELASTPASEKIRFELIPGADHELSLRGTQQRLLALVEAWFDSVVPSAAR